MNNENFDFDFSKREANPRAAIRRRKFKKAVTSEFEKQ